MDDNGLELPMDGAFKLCVTPNNNYLILKVHYKNVDKFVKGKETDRSGLTLLGQYEPVKHLAGVFFTVTDGRMKPKSGSFNFLFHLN